MKKKTKAKNQALKIRENSVGWMIKMLTVSLDATMKEELSKLKLNINQFDILMTLSENEGLTQVEIGRKIVMPGFSTTRTIDSLQKKNLVERRKDERSRRSYRIYLTDRGNEIRPKLFRIVETVNERFLSALPAPEKKSLKKILLRLVRSRYEF